MLAESLRSLLGVSCSDSKIKKVLSQNGMLELGLTVTRNRNKVIGLDGATLLEDFDNGLLNGLTWVINVNKDLLNCI